MAGNPKTSKTRERLAEMFTAALQEDKMLDIMETFSRPRDREALGAGPVNAALIYVAHPDATYCMTYSEWNSHGCTIKSGSKGFDLFRRAQSTKDPSKYYYNLDRAFDVEQVTGNKEFIEALKQEERTSPTVDQLLRALTNSDDYAIEYNDELPDDCDSLYFPNYNLIAVRSGPALPDQVFSIIFELAHRQLSFKNDYDRTNVDEFIAWSSAYVVGRRYCMELSGIVFPKDFFPEQIQTPGEIKETISSIYVTAKAVYKDLEKSLVQVFENEQEADLEDPDLGDPE